MGMVIIRRYSAYMEAELARAALEGAEIPADLLDANTIRINWFYSGALGGIKLVVAEEHATEALEVLGIEPETAGAKPQECPACKSRDISFRVFLGGAMMAISWFLLGLPYIFFKKNAKCNSCGHRWRTGM